MATLSIILNKIESSKEILEKHYNVMNCDTGATFYKRYQKKAWALKKAEILHKKARFIVVEEYVNGEMKNVWWFEHKFINEFQLN